MHYIKYKQYKYKVTKTNDDFFCYKVETIGKPKLKYVARTEQGAAHIMEMCLDQFDRNKKTVVIKRYLPMIYKVSWGLLTGAAIFLLGFSLWVPS